VIAQHTLLGGQLTLGALIGQLGHAPPHVRSQIRYPRNGIQREW